VAWLADARPSRMSPLPSRQKIAPLRVTVAPQGAPIMPAVIQGLILPPDVPPR